MSAMSTIVGLIIAGVSAVYVTTIRGMRISDLEFCCISAILVGVLLTMTVFRLRIEAFSDNIQQINNRLIMPRLKDLNQVLEKSSKNVEAKTVDITPEYVKDAIGSSKVEEFQLAYKFIDQMLCQMSVINPKGYEALLKRYAP